MHVIMYMPSHFFINELTLMRTHMICGKLNHVMSDIVSFLLESIVMSSLMQEMLRPIPVALASCTRFFEAMTAMRESFATLQKLRVGDLSPSLPATPIGNSPHKSIGDVDCVTPPPWSTESLVTAEDEVSVTSDTSLTDGSSHRRLSWPPSKKV